MGNLLFAGKYKYIDMDIGDKQDGELLQFFGSKIRKENPYYLLDTFTSKINESSMFDLITNDDCRPPDYDYLKALGFKFILINGYKRSRDDHRPINSKSSLEWNDSSFNCDYILDNLGTIDQYQENIINLVKRLKR
jgi:hypothetical protein